MGIKHEAVKRSCERGYAREWNADHIIDGNVDFAKYQAQNLVLHSGTSFPVNPVEGQKFYRTDLHKEYTWNGTKWVISGDSLRAATKIVAASNSIDKEKADYVCDGIDDQVEINAAINEVTQTGGRVILLEGMYKLSNPIVLKSAVILEGSGYGPSWGEYNGTNPAKGTWLTTSREFGPLISATNIGDAVVRGISTDTREYDVITFISLSGCNNILIENNQIAIIEPCINVNNCTDIVIQNNGFWGGLGEMFNWAIEVNNSTGVRIKNNYIRGGDEYSILVKGTSRFIDVEGNYVTDSRGIIRFYDSTSDCILRNNLGSGYASRILIEGDRIAIVGNVIYGNMMESGLTIASTADRCTVVGNIIRNTTQNYNNQGTNTAAAGNNF
ncbi:MAG: right-handed parallel beta-helix repeat-containing protein [Nitrososphaerota archaeon]